MNCQTDRQTNPSPNRLHFYGPFTDRRNNARQSELVRRRLIVSYVLCSSCRGRCNRSLAPRQSNISSRDHQPRRLSSATRKRIYSPANSARQGRHRTRQCDLTFALSQICAPDICSPPERKPTIADIRRWLGLKFRVMGLVFRVTVRVRFRIRTYG